MDKDMMYPALSLLSIILSVLGDASKEDKAHLGTPETCLDHKGKVVSHGDKFFPSLSDPCTQCTCSNGKQEMCISVFCSAPENCRDYHALTDKCCEFVCLDRDFPNKGSGNGSYPDTDSLNTTNLGLRLVASTVTSFLILALLLFMIHRLRQRRLLLMIRRFHARRMDSGSAHLSRRYSEDEDGSVGYFVGHDHLDFSRYDEPPPPYTLWKPPEVYIPPGEAPPPYDLSVQLTAPFTGNGRFSFPFSGRLEFPQRTVPPANSVEHRVEAVEVVPPSTIAVVHQNEAQQQSAAELPVSVSVATTTTTITNVETETQSTSTSERIILPPDLQYEDSSNCMPSITLTTPQPEQDTTTDVAIDMPNTSNSTAKASMSNQDETSTAGLCCTCNAINSKSRPWSKRHSCSDFSGQVRSKSLASRSKRDKRLSLNSFSHNASSSLYPDPTIWNGDVSESSSSSSPTYDQPTPSPSTSDSSFADTEFSKHHSGQLSTVQSRLTPPIADGTKASLREYVYGSAGTFPDIESKAPSLQKTLTNLKKFSLMKRRKKKRREERNTTEISCSFVCQTVTDPSLMPPPLTHLASSEASLPTRISDMACSRPIEAINPHIGHKLASSGIRKGTRPTSISVSAHPYRLTSSMENTHSNYYHSLYATDTFCSPSSTIIAVHHKPRKKGSVPQTIQGILHKSGQSPSLQSSASSSSPPEQSGKGITRSGSICSETGERRYHHTSPSSGTSQPRPANEDHEQKDRYHSKEPESQASGSNQRYSFRNTHDMGNHENNTAVWIVNSEVILPRQEYHFRSTRSSPSALLSRCLSAGQINENSADTILGSHLHPALQIRDPSMCDSSWEACSHL